MNLILFDDPQAYRVLSGDDPRAVHVRDVLKMSVGDCFDVGLVNGPRGKATITADDDGAMTLDIVWGQTPPAPHPVTLLIGLPRPQTARKILQECTSLGVAAIHTFRSDKAEASYARSRLWHTSEWRRHLIRGAEQAFTTHIPEVRHHPTLATAVTQVEPETDRIALDVYEADRRLGETLLEHNRAFLAIGPERGWSAAERDVLRAAHFTLAHLGPRVLRTETACLTAISIVATKLGLL